MKVTLVKWKVCEMGKFYEIIIPRIMHVTNPNSQIELASCCFTEIGKPRTKNNNFA